MVTILKLRKKYHQLIAPLDMELLFSFVLKKTREFVLAHPEHNILAAHSSKLDKLIKRRAKGEPIAYILGTKEFYGLEFKVNKNTLIPRPETELIVDLALEEVRKHLHTNVSTHVLTRVLTTNIIDIGTGSGNIIISLVWNMEHGAYNNINFYGIDTSKKALLIAKKNANTHKLNKKIKFFQGNLLNPITKNCSMFHACLSGRQAPCSMIILANLPYLSSKIYSAAPKDVRLYEPKSALYSPQNGLNHYIELLQQIAELSDKSSMLHTSCYMEISPEQKNPLQEIIKQIQPCAKIKFFKDLSGRWRICKVEI